jgi:hypothetical protein
MNLSLVLLSSWTSLCVLLVKQTEGYFTVMKFPLGNASRDVSGRQSMLWQGKEMLSLCLTKYRTMKTCLRSGGIAPRILDLGTRWRWVVSFTPWPLYAQRKSPRYAQNRMLGGPRAGLDMYILHLVTMIKWRSMKYVEWGNKKYVQISYWNISWGKIRVKVKLTQWLTKYHAIMTYPILN